MWGTPREDSGTDECERDEAGYGSAYLALVLQRDWNRATQAANVWEDAAATYLGGGWITLRVAPGAIRAVGEDREGLDDKRAVQ